MIVDKLIIDDTLKNKKNIKNKELSKKGGHTMKKNVFKRVISLVIALMMIMPGMPFSAYADEGLPTEYEELQTQDPINEDEALTEGENGGEPSDEDPPVEEPSEDESVDEEPSDDEPADEEPADEEPADEEPTDEEPADQDPPAAEPSDDEPTDEDPPAEDPPVEEPPVEELPVEVPQAEGPIVLTYEMDEISVEVFADEGVLPEGTQLRVDTLSDDEIDRYLNAIENGNEDILIGFAALFDITLLEEEGNPIQPKGEVRVSFYGLDHISEDDDVFVYHVEPQKVNMKRGTFLIMMDMESMDQENEVDLEDFSPEVERGRVSFNTSHFSIYIVGTNIRHDNQSNRYQMYVGEILQLEERNSNSGGNWSVSSGNSVNIISSSNNQNNIRATVKGMVLGNSTVRYRVGSGASQQNTYFYIAVGNHDQIDPALPPVTDPNALPPGTVAAEKTAKWVDYSNRIAEINLKVEGMPIISGSDVILVMDVSGSMQNNSRIGTAKAASKEFISNLLGGGNPLNNRIAFVPFSDGSGSTNGSINFSYDINILNAYVDLRNANGYTNYTSALNKALDYVESRLTGEESRPLYVVFMSDGEPNEGFGTAQAAELMNVHNATIYTVGIQLTGSAPDALKNISTYVNGQPLYQNVTNMSDLAPVLNAIAEDIKLAGTAAVFKDFISEYFEYYNVAPYNTGDGTYDPILEVVTISVGNINKVPDNYKIYVQLKAEYWLEDQIYPTNEDIHLDYIDVDGEPAHKDKFEIGHPDLSVGFGTITVKYVLVNEVGQYIDSETGVLVDYAFRDFVPAGYSHLFEYGGSTSLEVEQTYTVTPSVPAGYTLYQPGETITQEVSWDNTNPTVEFKVVRIDTVDITVTKTWIGTPGTITIDLYANGVLHDSKDLTGEGTVTFDNLPKFDSNGEISYTVTETTSDGTQLSAGGNARDGFTFTNVSNEKVEFTVNKEWLGPVGESATVKLMDGETEVDSVELNAENNWTGTLEGPKYDEEGNEIEYDIVEVEIDNYDSEVVENQDGTFTVKNTNNEKVEFRVNKEWLGPVGESATVKLIDGETEVDSVELNAENNWTGTLEGPKYDEEGNEIEYAIVEEEIDNYDSEVVDNENGSFTIINTNNETVDIYVYKYWDDNGEEQQLELFSTEEGVKPTITFRLWVGDTEIDSITLENGELEGVFKDKPVYDLEGNRINYAITEDSIPGYAADIYGPFEDGDLYVEIINTIQKFNVYYNANGGSGTMNDENNPYKYNSSVTVLANTFTRSNYRFIGWNTAANGSGTSYAVGATFTMPAHDVTLYAQWQSGGGGGGGGGGGTIIE
jgi:uncharacterized repeat protein (TIGR02543 family)